MVSNGLSFTFLKNKEIQEVFRFIIPVLKLSEHHIISNRILSKSAKQLTQLIVDLMNNVKLKQIKINCYISDSAGEHATARCQLRIEYSNKVFLSYITHQMNLVVDDIFKKSL
ncbi:unnamed protein product [Rhizophagus irregularis]|nr:unnamed protein product [Rhizophagus irregularis]